LLPPSLYVKEITYGNGRYVAITTYDEILVSYSITTSWSKVSNPKPGWTLDSIVYGNGLFLVVARKLVYPGPPTTNFALTSSDGFSWNVQDLNTNVQCWNVLSYGNGLFVLVDENISNNNIYTSSDGITWNHTYSSLRATNGIAYGNGIFIALHGGSLVSISRDCINWEQVFSGGPTSLMSVAYGDGLFVAVSPTPKGSGQYIITAS
jgi:hypothetical protein